MYVLIHFVNFYASKISEKAYNELNIEMCGYPVCFMYKGQELRIRFIAPESHHLEVYNKIILRYNATY